MLEIRLNKAHFPVTALGPGRRIAFWVQGCSIRCAGCISRDTWEFGGETVAINVLLDEIAPWLEAADGMTISGGEPCDQFPALLALLDGIRGRGFAGDVLVFSGYEFDDIGRRFDALLGKIDALVSGPFVQEQATSEPLRGSANQELHLLSEMGRERFVELSGTKRIDLHWDGSTAWLAGIPQKGDWQRVREKLDAAGISAGYTDDSKISWKS